MGSDGQNLVVKMYRISIKDRQYEEAAQSSSHSNLRFSLSALAIYSIWDQHRFTASLLSSDFSNKTSVTGFFYRSKNNASKRFSL